MSCIVWGCTNNNVVTAHYHVFPKHPMVAQQWIEASGWPPEQVDLNFARICSLHFEDDSYTTESNYTKQLKYDAVPTLYLPSSTHIVADDMIVFAVPTQQLQQTSEHADLQADKYRQIQTQDELRTIINCNATIRQKVDKLESSVRKLREANNKLVENYRKKDLEVTDLHSEYLRTKRSFLSLNQQKRLLSKVFSESQIKILSGKKKIYWSNDDMAVGYTIRHLSNKRCYLYLTKRLNVPLPAVSSIKRWMTLKNASDKTNLADEKKNEDEDSDQ